MAENVGFASSDYWNYWGKARPNTTNKHTWHPLACHSLDVAAMAAVLLSNDRMLCGRAAKLFWMSEIQAQSWLPWLIGLHDIGKFSYPFQWQRDDLVRANLGLNLSLSSVEPYHDAAGASVWRGLYEGGVPPLLATNEQSARELWNRLVPLVHAVTGHHGAPPENLVSVECKPDVFDAKGNLFALEHFIRDWTAVCALPKFEPADLRTLSRQWKAASWWLAGFATLFDLSGSNKEFFNYLESF